MIAAIAGLTVFCTKVFLVMIKLISLFFFRVKGLSTIRAFRMESHFRSLFMNHADDNLRALFYHNSADRWMALMLESVGACIVLFCAVIAILDRGISPGGAGLMITYAINVTQVTI